MSELKQQIAEILRTTPYGNGVMAPLRKIMEAAREDKARSMYSLHDSVMNGDLVLGTEEDQAFNYGRIHKWIDERVSQEKSND